jgi:hypothetical protein
MDTQRISRNLRIFIRRYNTEFFELPSRGSALLELGALSVVAEHYRLNKYIVNPRRLKNGYFSIKTTARGYPANFSYFECRLVGQQSQSIELHANLQVESAFTKRGVYVVDVGIVKGGLQSLHQKTDFKALENKHLISFVEVKKLVVFPMLLAQFYGMVHEISPRFVSGRRRPREFRQNRHLDPALLTTGYLTNNGNEIVQDFHQREFKISIVTNFEQVLSGMRRGRVRRSPFDYGHIHKARNV